MKRKVLTLLVTIVLLACMTISVNAASASVNSATAGRGETVTFSATLSGSETVGMGGVAVSYDSRVLELVSGTCEVSGAMLTNFDAATGMGAFMFSGTGSVGGTLFTATFRVKDDAPTGTTTVSMDITLKDGANADISVSNSSGSITVVCNHSFTAKNTDASYLATPASCTNKAAYYYSCTGCGEKGTTTFENGETLQHTYTKQVITDAYKKSGATCTSKAVYYYCCETCTAKGTAIFEHGTTKAHTYTKQVITDTYKKSGATCTDKAVYYYCCETCTAKGTTTFEHGTALGHTGGTATCTAKAVCTRCSQPYGNMLEHVYTAQDATEAYLKSEATCTSKAVYYKNCATCDKAGTATFEHGTTKAHTYTKQVVTDTYKKSGATCTSKAVYYYCCETCTAKGTATFEHGTTKAHTYTKQVITDTYKKSGATCTDKAVYYYCCQTCTAKGTTTFEHGTALGHTGGTATCTAQAVCTRCSQPYGNMLEHVYTAQDATEAYLKSEATCTSKAVYYKNCATCDKAGTATFEHGTTKAHTYTKQVITDTYKKSGATCTAKAVYYYCCETCTAKGTATFEHGTTKAHTYTKQVITDTYKKSGATCTDKAVYYYCCQTCTAKGTNTFEHGTALGHTGGTATCTAKAVCTRCSQSYGNMLEHVYTVQDATEAYLKSEATCTSKAVYYKNCATCDKAGTATFEHGTTKAHTYTKQDTSATYLKDAATCQSAAVYYYSCTTCSAKGTETYTSGTVADHKFTKKTTTDEYKVSSADCTNAAKYYYCCETCTEKGTSTYSYGTALGHTGGTATCTAQAVCTRCGVGYGGTLAHSYTSKVTTSDYLYSSASCTSKALYYYSCDCGAKGNSTYEYGSMLDHDHTGKTTTDTYLKSVATCTEPAVYYYSCTSCGDKSDMTFEYGTAPGHSYAAEWSKDKDNHWHECSVCGDKKDNVGHIAGAAATEYTTQTCTVCAYIITPALGHTHKYETEWSNDSTAHWHACSGCSEIKDKADHSYTNNCDKNCDVCGYERNITHKYGTEWKSNETNHWHECSECGTKADEAAHIPGAEATETTAQKCTACGYVLREALGHTHSYGSVWNSDKTNHWHTCACGEVADKAEHNWDAGTETKAATTEAEGEMTYTCTVCSTKKTEPIEKLPAPTTPDKPAEPDKPVEPDKPAEPDKPTEPDKPVEPTQPGDTDGEKKGSGVILYTAIGAVVVAAACVAFVLLKKKK